MRMWHIYALIDPRTKQVRYIGKSLDPDKRLKGHCRAAKKGEKTHKGNWLRQLLSLNMYPLLDILESGEDGRDDASESEQRWVAYYNNIGAQLTNATSGGEVGYVASDETKRKQSLAKVNKVMPLPQGTYTIGGVAKRFGLATWQLQRFANQLPFSGQRGHWRTIKEEDIPTVQQIIINNGYLYIEDNGDVVATNPRAQKRREWQQLARKLGLPGAGI